MGNVLTDITAHLFVVCLWGCVGSSILCSPSWMSLLLAGLNKMDNIANVGWEVELDITKIFRVIVFFFFCTRY